MKQQTAVTLVLGGIGIAVITSTIKEVTGPTQKRAPAVYIPIGGMLAAVPLLILTDIDPDLAGMFGGLIGLGAIILNGKEFDVFTKATNPQTKLPPNTPPPPKVNPGGLAATGTLGSSVPIGSNAVARAVAFAQAAIGTPYDTGPGRFGPNYYDCSGLTFAAYRAAGITIGQDSYHQVLDGVAVPISPSAVQPGDLIFTRGDVPERDNGHVSIAISSTQEIMAPHHGAKVLITNIPYDRVQNIRRIVGG